MAPRNILIVSNPQDEHTHAVVAHLHKMGVEPILFHPEKMGSDHTLSLFQSADPEPDRLILTIHDRKVPLQEMDAIWYRRPRLVTFESNSLSTEALEFARDEWKAFFESAWVLMDGCFWVSRPDRLRLAARKPLQLQVARQVGLSIPHTRITNDPQEAREFYDLCNGRVIVKATGSGWVYSADQEQVHFVLTNRLLQEDLGADEEIRIAPVTFQEEVPKRFEVRANIVGQQVLAIQIPSQQSAISSVDWRRYDVENTPYTAIQLPPDIEQKCVQLTHILGLEFGAIDLICKPDGEYVFLEINGNGQFLWAEQLSGVRVSQAMASLLAGNAPA